MKGILSRSAHRRLVNQAKNFIALANVLAVVVPPALPALANITVVRSQSMSPLSFPQMILAGTCGLLLLLTNLGGYLSMPRKCPE